MRWFFTVAAHRASGAAAAAVALGQALRAVGDEVRLIHQRGPGAPSGFEGIAWAEPRLIRERRAGDIRANLHAVGEGARWADVVVTHLPHDHLLAVLAGAHRQATLIRSYRHPRHLRSDPLHRWLARRAAGGLLANSAMAPGFGRLSRAPMVTLPVPVADRFRPSPAGPGSGDAQPTVGVVGKLAEDRGFESVLAACARLDRSVQALVIGHGELQWRLETLAWRLGIADRITWAGKRDSDLPALLASTVCMVFAAPGSDWGHRAISEAQACGRPVIAADHAGVADLVHHGSDGLVTRPDPESIAAALSRVVDDPDLAAQLGNGAAQAVEDRRLEPIARRLWAFVEQLPARSGWAQR